MHAPCETLAVDQLLAVDQVSVSLSGRLVLDDVSFTLARGNSAA